MRQHLLLLLLVLSAFSLGAHALALQYRNNLLAYAPARGQFPVENGLAQGYVRYLDGTGAERLLAYTYPEPLYAVRRLSYGTDDSVNPLLRTSSTSDSQDQVALFRAWCEQRYNALRLELDRLRAEGKQPSANMLAQFEPLEQIVKTAAYEPVPGLSAEVQRAREEHLRIWNEARLQVLRAEQEQLRLSQPQPQPQPLQSQPQSFLPEQPIIQLRLTEQNTIYKPETPQPVQETPEVLRAREEHLKKFNEALKATPAIQQPEPIAPIINTRIADTQPAAVQYTPEVLRAREEHLKLISEMAQSQPLPVASPQSAPTFAQTIQPVQDTPEVLRAREEHLRELQKAKIIAEDKVADLNDLIRIEEREREAERLRDIERISEEKRLEELERLREDERQKEETRMLEAERLALEQQEQQRMEAERIEEENRLKAERLELEQNTKYETPIPPAIHPASMLTTSNFKVIVPPQQPVQPVQPQLQPQQQQQVQQNGFFLRIQSNTNQPAAIDPATPNTALYYSEENPFLIRYIQSGGNQAPAQPVATQSLTQPEKPMQIETRLNAESQPQQLKAEIPTMPALIEAGGAISELEKATREHFRAHEIALEQLRIANTKNPWNPDCNH